MGEGSGEGHSLLLSPGKLSWHPVPQSGEPDELEQLVPPPAPLGGADPADAQRELDVLGDRHLAEQRIVLENHADPPPLRREQGHVASVKEHAPVVDFRKPRDHPQDRALAAPARPQKHEELPVGHLDRDMVDDGMPAVDLHEILENDRHELFLAVSVGLAYSFQGV